MAKQKDWENELEDLTCINGAMYFGSVEKPCKGRETGECCHNEQTYNEAITELKNFIQNLLAQQKKEIVEEIRKELLAEMSGKKVDYGHECYDYDCDYCLKATQDNTIEYLLLKLPSLNILTKENE